MPDDVRATPPASAARPASIEGRASWVAAGVTLAILSVAYGSTLLIVVGLRAMEANLDVPRSVLALAGALTWIGTGTGGIAMGWFADRIGVRTTVLVGAVMVAAGLALSATGYLWAIYIGHGVLIGFLGMGAIFPPLVTYVSRWFDRRRGTAIALVSSGQYIAGVAWPPVFAWMIDASGWRETYFLYAGVVLLGVLPLALLFLGPPPEPSTAGSAAAAGHGDRRRVLGLPRNVVQAMICAAGFCCCVPMSIPQGHLVAFCGDLGIPAASGAAMLSLLLGCAFVSRQLWGSMADRHGGLATVLAGSACQALAMVAFLLTQNETGLFMVAAAYGLGFSGIIPSYVVAIRDVYPSPEASWRVPLVLFTAMCGMAFGSWFAGRLYELFGSYAPAFGTGIAFNIANLLLIGFLVARQRRGPRGLPDRAFAAGAG
jgi:MFS family permease